MSERDPYTPPTAAVADPRPAVELPLAGRGQRWLAKVVDNILLVILVFAVLMIATGMGYKADPALGAEDPVAGVSSLVALLTLGPIQLYLLLRRGQTIGKRIFKIRIVSTDRGRPHPLRLIFMRSLVPIGISVIPIVNILFFLFDSLMIFGPEQRCLHDYFAGTIVVDLRETTKDKEEILRLGSIRSD